jgi:DNA-binding LacI/PurR family transcriptional regulator
MRLEEVARRAGVSTATVSRVLNERPGVREHTRQDVLRALELLGYERPPRLRRKSGGVVGLIVPELTNPVFPAFALAIEELISRRGYTQIVCSQHVGGVHEDEHVRRLLEHGVSGIVFLAGIHAVEGADLTRYRTLVERGVPVVFVNGRVSGLDAPFVSVDDDASMVLAVHHLVSLGHTRIGLAVGPTRYTTVTRKRRAFLAALADEVSPHAADPDLVASTVFSVEGGATAAGRLLDRGATAVVCGSDVMALGAVQAARRRGLQVPEQLSVVGFDDNPLLEHTAPPLTTLRQPVGPMAGAAVAALFNEMAGEHSTRGELLFRPELVVRASTAPPAHVPAPR